MTTDHAQTHMPKRERLRLLLWDLRWHAHAELRGVAGVRYSARLLELKRLGFEVEDEPIQGDTGKRYRLKSHTPGAPKVKLVKVYLREQDCARLVERGEVGLHLENCIAGALQSFRQNKDKL